MSHFVEEFKTGFQGFGKVSPNSLNCLMKLLVLAFWMQNELVLQPRKTSNGDSRLEIRYLFENL